MDPFNDKQLLPLILVVLSVFFGVLILGIVVTDGLENAIFPAVLFPSLFVFIYLMNRDSEKNGKQAASGFKGILSGFFFFEVSAAFAIVVFLFSFLVSFFIRNVFFNESPKAEVIVEAEYRPMLKNLSNQNEND